MVWGEATTLQLLPFAIVALLQYFILWEKKTKLNVWILVTSVVMFFVNLTTPVSWIDVIYWIMAFAVFVK